MKNSWEKVLRRRWQQKEFVKKKVKKTKQNNNFPVENKEEQGSMTTTDLTVGQGRKLCFGNGRQQI